MKHSLQIGESSDRKTKDHFGSRYLYCSHKLRLARSAYIASGAPSQVASGARGAGPGVYGAPCRERSVRAVNVV